MKQILTLTLIFICLGAMAQTVAPFNHIDVRSINQIPRYNSLSNATAAGSKAGNFVFVYASADSGLHVRSFDNSRWIKVTLSSGGGGGSYTAGPGIEIVDDAIRQAQEEYLSQYPLLYNMHQKYTFGGDSSAIKYSLGTSDDMKSASFQLQLDSAGSPYNGGTVNLGASGNLGGGSMFIYEGGVWIEGITSSYGFGSKLYVSDSIRIKTYKPDTHEYISYSYNIASTGKYKVVLMDSATGSLVVASPELIKRQSPGTPSSNADTQGTQGDLLYDSSYIYIKTAAGWKRVSLSTF